MELLAKKIEERFSRVADAYRYFASFNRCSTDHQHQYIAMKDFIMATESLRLNLHRAQAQAIFEIIDTNGDGLLDYREFCNLAVEEKRRGIDPFDNEHKRQMYSSTNPESMPPIFKAKLEYQPQIVDHEEGPVGHTQDAMLASQNEQRGYLNRMLRR
jgi:EF-hand domain pair